MNRREFFLFSTILIVGCRYSGESSDQPIYQSDQITQTPHVQRELYEGVLNRLNGHELLTNDELSEYINRLAQLGVYDPILKQTSHLIDTVTHSEETSLFSEFLDPRSMPIKIVSAREGEEDGIELSTKSIDESFILDLGGSNVSDPLLAVTGINAGVVLEEISSTEDSIKNAAALRLFGLMSGLQSVLSGVYDLDQILQYQGGELLNTNSNVLSGDERKRALAAVYMSQLEGSNSSYRLIIHGVSSLLQARVAYSLGNKVDVATLSNATQKTIALMTTDENVRGSIKKLYDWWINNDEPDKKGLHIKIFVESPEIFNSIRKIFESHPEELAIVGLNHGERRSNILNFAFPKQNRISYS